MDAEWEPIQIDDDAEVRQIVRLNYFEGHGFDIRVIAIGKDDKIKVLTKNGIKTNGIKIFIIYFIITTLIISNNGVAYPRLSAL